MKPCTCGCESVRSMVRASPFTVTVARMWMSVKPCPSSSRMASPRYTPSFHVLMHARVSRSALSRISSTAAMTVLGPYSSRSWSTRRSPTRAEPIMARRSPRKSSGWRTFVAIIFITSSRTSPAS